MNTIAKIENINGKFIAIDAATNKDITSEIHYGTRRKAAEAGMWLECVNNRWFKVSAEVSQPKPQNTSAPTGHQDIMNFIHSSYDLKPQGLVMNELKWKYLVRSAVRGKNIMMTGQAGCGKTMAAKALVNSLERPDFYFNLGATQDPRATLIGNVHFNEGQGT